MYTNADAVLDFIKERRVHKWLVGDAFMLPDVEQWYEVVAVRVFKRPNRVEFWADFEAECAVPGCDNMFIVAKRIHEWRKQLYITRCCEEHRGQWKTEMPHAWKHGAEVAERQRRAEIVREAEVRAQKALGIVAHAQGPSEKAVLEAFRDLDLVYEAVPQRLIVEGAKAILPRPASKRDTRRQSVARALKSLVARGVLRIDGAGAICAGM